jgi:hypothetical protein
MPMTRHRFDPFSFVAGLLFVSLALFFLGGVRTPADLRAAWLWPVFILAPGALLVLYGVRRTIGARDVHSPEEEPDRADEPA